jgi:hypothetical protein
MRNLCGVWLRGALVAATVVGMFGCAAKRPVKPPTPTFEETPMPTVAARTPTPEPSAAPLPTRPIGKAVTARKGQPIGPIVTFFGAARADGNLVEPKSVDKKGVPTYLSSQGSGFLLVVEAKPGANGLEPGRRVFAYVADDPKERPDLEIESNRDLGNGSLAVCDRRKPDFGGVPAIKPPSFAETQKISNALNDLACRFEIFTESDSSCTLTKNGDYSFINKDTTLQFCMMVARAWNFPVGKTLLSVRLRDSQGNPGPVKQMQILRPAMPKKKK